MPVFLAEDGAGDCDVSSVERLEGELHESARLWRVAPERDCDPPVLLTHGRKNHAVQMPHRLAGQKIPDGTSNDGLSRELRGLILLRERDPLRVDHGQTILIVDFVVKVTTIAHERTLSPAACPTHVTEVPHGLLDAGREELLAGRDYCARI